MYYSGKSTQGGFVQLTCAVLSVSHGPHVRLSPRSPLCILSIHVCAEVRCAIVVCKYAYHLG